MLEYWQGAGDMMARRAREKSATGIYHVILGGINRQTIFEEDEDYLKLLEMLGTCQEKSGYQVYAYCLMSNHVHLLLAEGEEDFGMVFRRLGPSFVYWYNWKYNRRGHLFQGRYKSEVVETDEYFLTVLRYIHQNPVRAGIVKSVGDYKWSSYGEYVESPWICNTDFALGLYSDNKDKALMLFKEHNVQENQDKCLQHNQRARLNDTEARAFIRRICEVKSPLDIQGMEKPARNQIIRQCRAEGLSIRQIARLTGVSFGVIRRV